MARICAIIKEAHICVTILELGGIGFMEKLKGPRRRVVTLRLPREEYYALLSQAQSRSMTLDSYLEKYVFLAMEHLYPLFSIVDRMDLRAYSEFCQLSGNEVTE